MGGIDKMNLLSPPAGMPNAPRIAPLEPPYAADVAAALSRIHPSDSSREPLKLFRTMVRSYQVANIFGRHLNQDTAIMFHSAFIQTFATRAVVAQAVAPIIISQPTT
jgi:hypothetical protein